MDKVIIDKVDVSECEHYKAEIETKMPYGEYEILKDKCHYSGIEIIQDCKGIKGCIYKQLKRLEQENEELKADIESRTMCITCERELQNCNLQAESERLKEENYQLQKDCQICENFIDFIPCKPIRDMDYDLQNVISQRDNYYQALQEIRDIVETCLKLYKCEKCKIYKECQCDLEEYIIAKINEVIGVE